MMYDYSWAMPVGFWFGLGVINSIIVTALVLKFISLTIRLITGKPKETKK